MRKRLHLGSAFAGIAVFSMVAGGVLVAPAAFASEVSADHAPTDDAGYREFVHELIAGDEAITGVSQDGAGNVIVAAVEGTLTEETRSQLAEYDNIVFKDRSVAQAHGTDDVVGGAGYAVEREGVCSFGFSGWSATGDPAIITAGHCGVQGSKVERTRPSDDDAPYFPAMEPRYSPGILDPVGTFGFSQWGGPGNTEGSEEDLDSTDIAVIDVTNEDLTLLPKVTDWETWETEDLSASGTPVTAVGTARVGDPITRSGRSTGAASGVVEDGPDGTVIEDKSWVRVCEVTTPVPANCHWVFGFWTDADSRPGDSGGPFVRGTTAVGVLSGGTDEMSFATDLVNGLRLTPGYTVMLDLDEPAVTSAATVAPGGVVRGTGGAGLILTVTSGGSTFDVPVADDGTWSFAAPTTPGTVAYGLQISDAGYNRSESVSFTLTVDAALIAPPVITVPAAGASAVGPTVRFAGTGEPTATMTLTGDAVGSTTVAADGTWSVEADVGYGAASVTATQSIFGASSTATVDLVVAPAAPTLTSPANGSVLASAPTEITGTALPGATVTVLLNGVPLQTVTLPSARALEPSPVAWSVPVTQVLAAGTYDLVAVQTVNGAASEEAGATFTVAAAEKPTPTPVSTRGGDSPQALSDTGLDAEAAFAPALIAGGLLLAGAVLMLATRRVRTRAQG